MQTDLTSYFITENVDTLRSRLMSATPDEVLLMTRGIQVGGTFPALQTPSKRGPKKGGKKR